MDLDGDGNIDILSGSYSRMEGGMAGLFQVLRGQEDGTFAKPVALSGNDGEPLIISPTLANEDDDGVIQQICTRPTAVDLDGDGHLDIVSGNFIGTFAVFYGEEGGTFDPLSTFLEGADGKPLTVGHHSDPTFVDWDGDGDLDMLSGTGSGGAWMFPNVGTTTEPKFGKKVRLLPDGPERAWETPLKFGTDHIEGAQGSTRVTPADVDGDGKLDLLVGDALQISYPANGLSEEECLAALEEWKAKMDELVESGPQIDDWENMDAETSKKLEAHQELISKHYESRKTFIDERMTGHVWLYRRK